MKPAPFRYVPAQSLEQALLLKSEYGEEAKFLAGGQSLMPLMNFRLAQPAILIDINPLPNLDRVKFLPNGGVQIGALTRYRTLERDASINSRQPLLREALPLIAHPQIRNRGTFGGNLSHADPASELPALVLARGGRLLAQSKNAERWINARDFFVRALTTALRSDEMLVAIELPAHEPFSGSCFMEVARRQGDFALIGVAATVTLRNDEVCANTQLAYCNAGDSPVLAVEAGKSLIGSKMTLTDIDNASSLAQRAVDPGGNLHASKEFQRHLVGVLTRRALKIALERALSSLHKRAERLGD